MSVPDSGLLMLSGLWGILMYKFAPHLLMAKLLFYPFMGLLVVIGLVGAALALM